MTKQVIICGEVKIGPGCVHQNDLAQAMGVERLTSIPKKPDGVRIVVGRLLRGKEPAILKQAKKAGLTVVTVDEVMNDDVRAELRTLLALKSKREKYEQAALDHLKAAPVAAMSNLELQALVVGGRSPVHGKPKRGDKKSKVAANG